MSHTQPMSQLGYGRERDLGPYRVCRPYQYHFVPPLSHTHTLSFSHSLTPLSLSHIYTFSLSISGFYLLVGPSRSIMHHVYVCVCLCLSLSLSLSLSLFMFICVCVCVFMSLSLSLFVVETWTVFLVVALS